MAVVEEKEPFATEEQLTSFKTHLLKSKNIIALSGAGLSASSGIPTFRGLGGHWRNYDAIQLATPQAFAINPVLVWQFYAYRRHNALDSRPNPGHYAIADLASKMNPSGVMMDAGDENHGSPTSASPTSTTGTATVTANFLHLTQNVDGLLQRAGHPKENLKRLHGDLFMVECTSERCGFKDENFKDPITPKLEVTEEMMKAIKVESDYQSKGIEKGKKRVMLDPCQPPKASLSESKIKIEDLPACPKCKSLLRPSIVWFGEPLPMDTIGEVDEWLKEAEKIDLCLVVGTSAEVYPAAGHIKVARSMGAKVCVVNLEDVAEYDDDQAARVDTEKGDWLFMGDSAEILPEILKPVIGDLSWLWRGLDRRASSGENKNGDVESSLTCKLKFHPLSFIVSSLSGSFIR